MMQPSRRLVRFEQMRLLEQPGLQRSQMNPENQISEDAYLFQKDIKNNSLVILQKVGHIPMEESPHAVAKAILEFIKE